MANKTSTEGWADMYAANDAARAAAQPTTPPVERSDDRWDAMDELDLRMFAPTHERYKAAIQKRFRLEGK